MVGVTGFEPAASWSRTKRSTKLSHTPVFFFRREYYNTEKMVCQAQTAQNVKENKTGQTVYKSFLHPVAKIFSRIIDN